MLAEQQNDMLHFLTILQSIEKIKFYLKDIESPEEFIDANEQMNFNATLILMANIGETINKCSVESKEKLSILDVRNIIGLRNRIAHDYTGVNSFMIYRIATTELDQIKCEVESVFREYVHTDIFDSEEFKVCMDSEYYSRIDFGKLK